MKNTCMRKYISACPPTCGFLLREVAMRTTPPVTKHESPCRGHRNVS